MKGKVKMNNLFNGMFGKIAPGLCKYSIDGKIAIKTSSGYKSYDVESGQLVNCSDFAFDVGENFFFIIPTNKVERGDIILASGKPACVIEVNDNSIKVFRYETSAVENIVPENYVFMGKTYFYGKIVSLFGNISKDGNMNQMMKYMMLSQMMGGNKDTSGFGQVMPFMLMGSDFNNMFNGLFDFGSEAKTEEKE